MAITFVALGADENGTAIGTHTVTVAIDPGGQGWHGSFRIDIAGADGLKQGSAERAVTGGVNRGGGGARVGEEGRRGVSERR